MLKHVLGWLLLTLVCMVLVATGQQPAPRPTPQQSLGQALEREMMEQRLCLQRQEAIGQYFQAEMQKLAEERDALKAELEKLKQGSPENPRSKE